MNYLESMKKKLRINRFVIIGIILYFLYVCITQQQSMDSYDREAEQYKSEIVAAQKENEKLQNVKDNVDSEEYIETYHNTRWNKVKWSTTVSPTNLKWFSNNTSVRGQWIANSSTGYKASIVFKTKTGGITIEWYETGIRYEVGTGVL